MLISVLNIKVTCEWHKAIKLNYKNTRTAVVFVLRFPSTLRRPQLVLSCDVRAPVRWLQHTEEPHLHTWYTNARGHSTSGQTWTTLDHLKNVLSCVNRSYRLPFRLHSNAWKTTIVKQCLLNTCKYASRRNSPFGVTSSIFLNSSTCIAIAKSTHKMHITIFHVGKHKRYFCTSQLTN